MHEVIETPVLIAGGGPVGLALSLDLAHQGIASIVAEQDAGTALVMLAKAGTLNERTMEFCRRWGLVGQVAKGFPDDYPRDNVYCTSLSGFLIGRTPVPSTLDRGLPDGGPEMLRRCGQHLFDKILADAVMASGRGQVRYNARFERFVQDGSGVTSELTDTRTGQTLTVRSQYLVACDGSGSTIRKALGIGFSGEHMDYSLSAMVRIPRLEAHHRFGRAERFMFIGPEGTWANMTSVDGESLWRFTVVGSEAAIGQADFDVAAVIRRAFGGLDIPFEIVRIVPWRRAQFLADSYREGRVLLAGDAVHTTSPTGGHGVNTGIGDATDVSWMLAALLQGWGGQGLLEAYTTERRQVALRNFSSSTQNYKVWVGKGMGNVAQDGPQGEAARRNIGAFLRTALHQEWFSQGIGMGYCFEGSPLIVPDGTPRPHDDPTRYVQTSRPGHRAPHAWLADGRSALDLFGKGFVLLRFGAKAPDATPLLAAASRVGMPLHVVHIQQPEIGVLYERSLVLVRPDGMVAWRGDALPDDAQVLVNITRGH